LQLLVKLVKVQFELAKKILPKYCKPRRTVREPRNTSLVLIRCDGSYETTLLSPGSHAFRCCKQGPYKQNISRNVHTLLVVMKIKVQPIPSCFRKKSSSPSNGSTTKMITITHQSIKMVTVTPFLYLFHQMTRSN